MTDRYMIIHIGSPDEFVLKDTMEKRTYGMFSNEQEKTMRRLCDDMNALHEENQQLKRKIIQSELKLNYQSQIRASEKYFEGIEEWSRGGH